MALRMGFGFACAALLGACIDFDAPFAGSGSGGTQSSSGASTGTGAAGGQARGDVVWAKAYGDDADQSANAIAVDGRDIVVGGDFAGNVDFGGTNLTAAGGTGDTDVFVARLDEHGSHIASRRDGGSDHDTLLGVASAASTVATGYFQGSSTFSGQSVTATGADLWLAAYTKAELGDQWGRAFGDVDPAAALEQVGRAVAMRDGAVAVCGNFTGSIDFGGMAYTASALGNDMIVAKFDSAMNLGWSRRFGGTGDDVCRAIGMDLSGAILLAGDVATQITANGDCMATDSAPAAIVIKVDASGMPQWCRAFGASGEQHAYGVASTPSMSVVTVGSFVGTIDFGQGPVDGGSSAHAFVVELDSNGSPVRSATWGNELAQRASAVAVDDAGRVFVAGTIRGSLDVLGKPVVASSTHDDAFVLALDPTGKLDWITVFGGSRGQAATSLASNGSDLLVAAGTFGEKGAASAATFDWGSGLLGGSAGTNAFVVRLLP